MKQLYTLILAICAISLCYGNTPTSPNQSDSTPIDTAVMVDRVQVSAIKQGLNIRNSAIANSVITSSTIEAEQITAPKELAAIIPNLHIPDYGSKITSSIYVRGMGARIDQPVMGLNIDNAPITNKNSYDVENYDIERIEVLRGPQSALYGRNTMGGVMNIYTLSPLQYQGQRIELGYGNGNSINAKASSYHLFNSTKENKFAFSIGGNYNRTDGFMINEYDGTMCDNSESYGFNSKQQFRSHNGLMIDNVIRFNTLSQGGYPYYSVATGEIDYNDPTGYNRTTFSDALTIRKQWEKVSISSITSVQLLDDEMTLDQDFTPESIFTLTQKQHEWSVTQDIVVKSANHDSRYKWLVGIAGMYKWGSMEAPVTIKEDGINSMILANVNKNFIDYIHTWDDDNLLINSDFTPSTFAMGAYHQSELKLGRWNLNAALRLDYEYGALPYHNYAKSSYTRYWKDSGEVDEHLTIDLDNNSTLKQLFFELLPRVAASYTTPSNNTFYASIARGYKSGGFNTQMFSDVLQQQLMYDYFGVGHKYDTNKIVTYKPESSWNYEIGAHLLNDRRTLRADIAMFYIDLYDQQLTVFPDGLTSGRMMTNAGGSRSWGGEVSMECSIGQSLSLIASYGYTNAKFTDFETNVKTESGKVEKVNYKGNFLPYSPQNTASIIANYTIETNRKFVRAISINGTCQAAGKIYWNEQNDIVEPIYATVGCSLSFELPKVLLSLWGKNVTNSQYNTFYFKSMGNEFMQHARPATYGVTLKININ